MTTRLALVKPPESSSMDFGTFSLAVLGAYVRDIAALTIVDATELSLKETLGRIAEARPNVVGVTTMSLDSLGPARAVVKALRESGFRGMLVAGGHGATMLPRELLESGADAVVYGEGEATFRDVLASGAREETPGLFLLRGGLLLQTPPRPHLAMDALPEPLWDLIGQPANGVAMVETSRGCPHRCRFCETTRFHSSRWRARSPRKVVRDVRRLVRKGATVIQVVDDNFLADAGRALEICELLSGGPLPLFFIFSARSDDLIRDADLIPRLAEARFLRVNVGVETVDEGLAARVGKKITCRQHQRAFAAMRRAGIYTVASFIVGLPGETEASRQKSLAAALEFADSARFVPFQPFPGIPIGDGSGEPEPCLIQMAGELNRAFDDHPSVRRRKRLLAKEPTVRGLLTRASLAQRQG
jgi:anaerobic magnesium-protoporphyrin IX monomethyl ester cyclase